ncbi:LysM peptidoglycan-binding domain-containing protein, partial [Streptomyces lasiicapitis]|uniref:LysM peptidoglycan-binding domain-containing protein n=1 Tax=Streptomyces lasiicapitis TaxID=1923961 RepID=UPI0036ADB6DA
GAPPAPRPPAPRPAAPTAPRPLPPPPPPAPPGRDRGTRGETGSGGYTVRSGDTLSRIAAAHGTSWQQIFAANRAVIGGDPDVIVPGQRLSL